MLRNVFFWKLESLLPCNANNVGPYTFVTLNYPYPNTPPPTPIPLRNTCMTPMTSALNYTRSVYDSQCLLVWSLPSLTVCRTNWVQTKYAVVLKHLICFSSIDVRIRPLYDNTRFTYTIEPLLYDHPQNTLVWSYKRDGLSWGIYIVCIAPMKIINLRHLRNKCVYCINYVKHVLTSNAFEWQLLPCNKRARFYFLESVVFWWRLLFGPLAEMPRFLG